MVSVNIKFVLIVHSSVHLWQFSSTSDEDFISEKLSGVERWLDLGLLLGLLPSTLVDIKSRHWEDSTACMGEMVHCWLSCHDRVKDRGGATLSSLTAALRDPLISCHGIASQLLLQQQLCNSMGPLRPASTSREGEHLATITLLDFLQVIFICPSHCLY